MKKILVTAALSIIASGALAAGDTSPHQFSGTATLVSDYVFKGLTQTWGGPAVQGSLDYVHVSGVWASLWASNISKKVVAGSNAEINLMAGYKGSINEHWSYGAGLIMVYYPGGNWKKMTWGIKPDQKYDFTEANVFVGYKGMSIKYSQTFGDLLGFNEKTGFSGSTKGSRYFEVNADLPIMETGFVLGLHAAHQDFKARMGNIDPDFNDYRISLSKSFLDGWTGALHFTRNTNTAFYDGSKSNLNENDMRDVGKRRLAIALTKLF